MDASADAAAGAGAVVVMGPKSIPDGPRIAVLRDPGGAVLGIHRGSEEG